MGDYTNLSIEMDISVNGDNGGGSTTPPTNLADGVLRTRDGDDVESNVTK